MKCLGALAENTLKKPYTRLCWRGISSTATVMNFEKVNPWEEEEETFGATHVMRPTPISISYIDTSTHFSTHRIPFDDAVIHERM